MRHLFILFFNWQPQVQRLLRIYQYSQKYEADWELAWLQAEQRAAELRKAEPQPAEDDAAGALSGAAAAALHCQLANNGYLQSAAKPGPAAC